MEIDLKRNETLISIVKNPNQLIMLDANFLICPNRKKTAISFIDFKEIWLDSIFYLFPNLAIHEAVYDEIINLKSLSYVDEKINSSTSKFAVFSDSSLSTMEQDLRNTIESKIYKYTTYEPDCDNKDDRGEVKSLAFIAVKGYLYFASNDCNAIRLIEEAEKLSTGLDNVRAIKMYDLIYYLYKKQAAASKKLKMLYKYQYYLTKREKSLNPSWGEFIEEMNNLYSDLNFS